MFDGPLPDHIWEQVGAPKRELFGGPLGAAMVEAGGLAMEGDAHSLVDPCQYSFVGAINQSSCTCSAGIMH